jgi:hypothetical protein
VLLATLVFGVNDAVGPRPLAWGFRYGTVLFYVPWLIALLPICACAAYWAKRAGAGVRARLIVATSRAIAAWPLLGDGRRSPAAAGLEPVTRG